MQPVQASQGMASRSSVFQTFLDEFNNDSDFIFLRPTICLFATSQVLASVSDPPDPRVFASRNPDPDPLVRGMDPNPALDPDPSISIIMQK
jgi:hypothetical protein